MLRHLATLLTVVALPALADRPLVSETADVIASGSCQVEAAALRIRTSGVPTLRGGDAFLSCGLASIHQAGLGYTRTSGDGLRTEAARLAGKTTLVAPEAGQTGWGVSYAIGAEKAPDTAWRYETLGLLAVATRELAPGLLGHANLGWSHRRSGRQNTTLWSFGLETTADLTVAADVFGDDRGKPTVSAGAGYTFGGGVSANVSYALLLDSPRVKVVTLGAKFVF